MEFQDMLAVAASDQLIALNTGDAPPLGSAPTNRSSPAFGFGVAPETTARVAVISPTPAAFGLTRTFRAVRISAPLTWSGVQLGWRASICATVPETTGAANDVPESWIRSEPTMLPAFCAVIVEPGAIGPTM